MYEREPEKWGIIDGKEDMNYIYCVCGEVQTPDSRQ